MGHHTTLLFLSIFQWASNGERESDLQDYCVENGFMAECPSGEILLMQEAVYGRMELGTCLTLDIGFMNCQSDVLFYMDQWCTGKHQCQVEVDDFVKLTDSCPREVVGYLRAKYTCLKVMDSLQQCCFSPGVPVILTDRKGYIAAENSGCGETTCSVLFRAPLGQQYNIWALWFNSSSADFKDDTESVNHSSNSCFVHANINEEGISVRMALCGSNVRRKHVYTSSTNELVIDIVNENQNWNQASRIIFEYEAFGCSDPILPDHGYVERQGDVAIVGCDTQDGTTWEISCHGNHWTGEIGNCTTEINAPDIKEPEPKSDRVIYFSPGIAIAIILFFAIVISVIIIISGIMCIKKYRDKRPTQRIPGYSTAKPIDGETDLSVFYGHRHALTRKHSINIKYDARGFDIRASDTCIPYQHESTK